MRSDEEILEVILEIARNDERIRAVIMNGSRVNPNVHRDLFQDFDIVYAVKDVAAFKDDVAWTKLFGEIMILQMPEAMGDPTPLNDGRFSYLMQFIDGNRIDLTLIPIAKLRESRKDSLSVLLLDKDAIVSPFEPPSENDYLPTSPTSKAFFDCCNEFWWVCPYVAKGLWREEIVYGKYMLDQVVRVQLMKMLVWHVGVTTEFSRNVGNHGKHLKQYLGPDLWSMLEKTYSDAGYDNTWDALFVMCDLFRLVANRVAEHFGFEYPQKEDENVSAHLRHVRSLPRDAERIY